MRIVKHALVIAFLAGFCLSWSEQGLVRLSVSPSLSVADGRSTVTVSAEVRDSSGKAAKDGTQVVFSTTLGNFREEIVPVLGGYARAILVAGTNPGVAKITASAISLNATAIADFEFVVNREMLSVAKEFIQVESSQTFQYNVDMRTIQASALDKGVSLRYRDIEIRADDLQLNVPAYEVKARRARVKLGRTEADFGEFYMRLNARKGFGTTELKVSTTNLVPFGQSVRIENVERTRVGLAVLRPTGVTLLDEPFNADALQFDDLSASTSTVTAKSAVAYPRKEIQFHRATVRVGDATVMKVPLYSLSINSPALVTENIVSVNNSQLAINYPYYLKLSPEMTSAIRFRMGETYGRGFASNRGTFLDYELSWTRDDQYEGGFTYSGIGRNDYSLDLRQSYRPDSSTNANLQASLVGGRSLFGSLNVSRAFDGFTVGVNGSSTQSVRGLSYNSQQLSFTIEKDPTKVGRLPFRLYYGLAATSIDTTAAGYNTRQSGAGVRARLQMLPQSLDKHTNLTSSLTVNGLVGRNTNGGLGVLGSLSVTRNFGRGATGLLTYDYADDGFTGQLLGKHRASLQMFYGLGKLNLSGVVQKSLDSQRISYVFDGGYRLSPLWRLSCYLTYDRYLTQSYQDFNFVVGYRMGWRDVGLVFSGRTNSIGIQVLGATFD